MKLFRTKTLVVTFLVPALAGAIAISSYAAPKTVMMASLSENPEPEKKEAFEVQTWNPLRLLVLKVGLTEPAWTSPWNYQKTQDGVFTCAYCGMDLFDAGSKYDSGSGWPSFWKTRGNVQVVREWDGRIECSCKRCKSHLGHVFLDGPSKANVDQALIADIPDTDPKGRSENSPLPRFCINGASLRFEVDED
mmetsp:Transcript_8034/g.11639  ORF Transcript_8034/g.11639 Transcript_8034/m.11639 type:complete len:192 (-) Transcript_8034:1673-2248(-)|eukprot:CAMPEP_0194223396 /NCGR_PEP_ID=MMETSP0156-20130528/35044_1 /TAXON_ID=33649 /ORGANISM="Thalassionema nitzschioides, Strain L26-B" /LENGTH=191 /DNA_ID=CAMNT_0038954521 /DNA_START=51 /DNA_END=626 /DNA_ORIENTATION=-